MASLSHTSPRRTLSLLLAAIAFLALFITPSSAQTTTDCNPTTSTDCADDTALGTSVTVNFLDGESTEFNGTSDIITYNSTGLEMSISAEGDAPTLASNWYIMFGKVSMEFETAPGTGIVSCLILLSDDLDEIDLEFLGGDSTSAQTNYYRKGVDGDNGTVVAATVADTQTSYHTYTIDWSETEIVWSVDGTAFRTVTAEDAGDDYPQSPMRVKFGIWAGGDPSNSAGTIAWAGGETDYTDGPYTMSVKSISVEDYSTGTAYKYSGETGDYEDIESVGGTINGAAVSDDDATVAASSTSTATADSSSSSTSTASADSASSTAADSSSSTSGTSTSSTNSTSTTTSSNSTTTSSAATITSASAATSSFGFSPVLIALGLVSVLFFGTC